MGAYGHSKIREFLVGSTTTRMIRQSKVPLLLLR
jgi:nucleotide-binding universal stress UspA family protein